MWHMRRETCWRKHIFELPEPKRRVLKEIALGKLRLDSREKRIGVIIP